GRAGGGAQHRTRSRSGGEGTTTVPAGRHFEAAALFAMKEIDLRVRTMAGFPNFLTGTAPMKQAFPPGKADQDAGPLVDTTADGGEAVVTMELFKGAIGLFKDPTSHRRVDYTHPTEAAEVLPLADLLMRLLNKIEGA
ncbi:TIGR02391 family protein, partial [Streptomyces sp. NPDC059466]|uniref:TIGR02391 family protein n=1 Tax=Streptomyces sp. NPDC059466 TaxID=3346843 RepID=UPI00369483DF